jgi:hypothetical protein
VKATTFFPAVKEAYPAGIYRKREAGFFADALCVLFRFGIKRMSDLRIEPIEK